MKRLWIFILIVSLSFFIYGADYSYYDGATGDGGTQATAEATTTLAADVITMEEIGTATYDDVQDWSSTTQSAGIISGFTITDSGSGQIDIAAGTGIIKGSASELGVNYFFDYAGTTNFALTDDATNYIYYYDNAGTITIAATVTASDIDHWTECGIGRVYRDNDVVHILSAGVRLPDIPYRVYQRFLESESIKRTSGLVTTEKGDLGLDVTAGVIWFGLSRQTISAVDTTGADTFIYHYNDGSWLSAEVSVINATQYNNYGVGLADLTTNNHFGCHFVYTHFETDCHVVYGTATYAT